MLNVSVISPEAVLFEGDAESVVAPAFDGEVGILTGHAPMMTLLGKGVLRLGGDSGQRFNVDGGFLAGRRQQRARRDGEGVGGVDEPLRLSTCAESLPQEPIHEREGSFGRTDAAPDERARKVAGLAARARIA